jgi:hypothetical protein
VRIGEEYDDDARYVVGEGDGGAAPFSLSLIVIAALPSLRHHCRLALAATAVTVAVVV